MVKIIRLQDRAPERHVGESGIEEGSVPKLIKYNYIKLLRNKERAEDQSIMQQGLSMVRARFKTYALDMGGNFLPYSIHVNVDSPETLNRELEDMLRSLSHSKATNWSFFFNDPKLNERYERPEFSAYVPGEVSSRSKNPDAMPLSWIVQDIVSMGGLDDLGKIHMNLGEKGGLRIKAWFEGVGRGYNRRDFNNSVFFNNYGYTFDAKKSATAMCVEMYDYMVGLPILQRMFEDMGDTTGFSIICSMPVERQGSKKNLQVVFDPRDFCELNIGQISDIVYDAKAKYESPLRLMGS